MFSSAALTGGMLRTLGVLFVLSVSLSIKVHATVHGERAMSCNVLQSPFEAVGDGHSEDTAAIRRALQSCQEVILPAPFTFLSGPLNLTDNQVLRIDGTLLAAPATDLAAYPVIANLPSYGGCRDINCFDPSRIINGTVSGVFRYSPVVGAFGKTNVSIVGNGTIDGQGQSWWDACTAFKLPNGRPRLVEINNCSDVQVLDLTLKNSPFWTLHPVYSRNIHVAGVSVYAPVTKLGNTDGIDPDSSSNVLIENCYIDNGDDGVALKAGKDQAGIDFGMPTENVFVRNVTSPAGSRGGVAIGSEMSGGVRNVTIQSSSFLGQRGIHIKSCPGRGGFIEDITFRDIESAAGISLSMSYKDCVGGPTPLVANVLFDNISGGGGCSLSCSAAAGGECFNMTFENMSGLKRCHAPAPTSPSYYRCDKGTCQPAVPGSPNSYKTRASCAATCRGD